MQNAGEVRADMGQDTESSDLTQPSSALVLLPPPPGAFLPPPPNCLFLAPNMFGGIKPRTEVDELGDPSLSTEERKEKFFAFIKKQKETIDGLVRQEIDKTLTLNDPQAFQAQLDVLLEQIKSEQRALSAIGRAYLRLVTHISDLEQELEANKNGSTDLNALQRQLDTLKSSLETVSHEIHAVFSNEPIRLAEAEECSKTERKRSEDILDLKQKLKTNGESIDALYNDKRALADAEIDLNKPNHADHKNALERNREKIFKKITALVKKREDLKSDIEEKTLSFRLKQTEDALLFGGLYAPINDLSRKIQSSTQRKNKALTAVKKRLVKEPLRSDREQELMDFINNGCSNNPEAGEKTTLPREAIRESIKQHITSNIEISDLLLIREQLHYIFSCETHEISRIIEELSEELLTCFVPSSMVAAGQIVMLPLKGSPLKDHAEFRKSIESLTYIDFITGDSLSPEDLKAFYPVTSKNDDIGDDELLRAMGMGIEPGNNSAKKPSESRLGARP